MSRFSKTSCSWLREESAGKLCDPGGAEGRGLAKLQVHVGAVQTVRLLDAVGTGLVAGPRSPLQQPGAPDRLPAGM